MKNKMSHWSSCLYVDADYNCVMSFKTTNGWDVYGKDWEGSLIRKNKHCILQCGNRCILARIEEDSVIFPTTVWRKVHMSEKQMRILVWVFGLYFQRNAHRVYLSIFLFNSALEVWRHVSHFCGKKVDTILDGGIELLQYSSAF